MSNIPLENVKYVIIKGSDEDGHTTYFASEERLNEILNGDEQEDLWFGEQLNFLSEAQFRRLEEDNPYHWKEFNAIIIRIDKILVPKPKIVKREFVIEEDED